MRLPRVRISRRLRVAAGLVINALSGITLLLDLPGVLGLPGALLAGGSVLVGTGILGWVLLDQGAELKRRDELDSLRDATEKRRAAFGELISAATKMDAEIRALRGEDREARSEEFRTRLNDWHAAADAAVLLHLPHRHGYFRNDAGLTIAAMGMQGWRETYVMELRRRVLRLDELQKEP